MFLLSFEGTSPGSTVGLNLKLPLYLGGPDPTASLSSDTGATNGFIGCVAEVWHIIGADNLFFDDG